MKYIFKNKELNIPDDELETLINKLDLTEEEAIQTWLEDNDYEENEEVEKLTKKAKENRITATIHEAKTEGKERKKRVVERKENPDKEWLIELFRKTLENEGIAASVENIGKIINFELNGKHFKLDLIQKREKKGK